MNWSQHEQWKKAGLVVLTICCLSSGYFYYKMNPEDWMSSSFFAIGLLGIILSLLRNKTTDN